MASDSEFEEGKKEAFIVFLFLLFFFCFFFFGPVCQRTGLWMDSDSDSDSDRVEK